MRRCGFNKTMGVMTILLAVFMAGCDGGVRVSPFNVTTTNPVNGASGVVVSQIISATFSNPLDASTISTSTFAVAGPGGTSVTGTVTSDAPSGVAIFTPASNLAANTAYTATVTTGVKDSKGNALASTFVWSFTTAPTSAPTVSSTTPANGATGVSISQPISATFSQAVNCSTVTTSTFTVTGPAGAAVTGTIGCAGTSATFTPTSSLLANTTYTATITTGVTNLAGIAVASNFVWSFTTGTSGAAAPTVTFTNPANTATGVPINRKITATFSQAMAPATITTSAFTVTGPGATSVTGAVTYDVTNNIATFTPASNLAVSTAFTATITTAVTNLAGTAMASNFVWSFTTGATTDNTAPFVSSTNPANTAIGVALNQKITATFSESMDASTINTTTFTLAQGTTPVSGTVIYAANGSIATFTPASNLAANTVYTATITIGAKDLAGNALAGNFVWSFTTGSTSGGNAPTVTSTNPASNAVSVPINKTISATFSTAMDPVKINTATFTLAGPASASVTGTVSYNATSQVATFTPASNLATNTPYTATITTGVTDLAGNALASNYVWSFTTGATVGPPPVALGAATTFGDFGGGAGMTNQGILTVVNGDIGTTGVSTTVTGFHDAGPGCTYTETTLNIGTVNGKIYTAPPPPTVACPTEGTAATFAIATQAAADALAAYNTLAALPGGPDSGAGQLGGLVLAPGTYTSVGGTFLITGTDLTLDAQGDPNAVWVFQMATSLTVGAPGAPRSVILVNGAQAKNVFWQVGSAATINAAGGGTMVGTIIAKAGVTFSTVGNTAITTLNGRALGLNASVTMVNTVINVPGP